MFGEARREAMGLHHFVSDTRRKVFICNDRREYKNLQGEVQKLEKRKANNMKKYDDEIKDWKEILKQLQDEKEGVGSIQCLIEANRETLKSSMTTRRQNAIKSVRRSLAPHPIQDFLHKPTVNHQLISKPPSVPRKVKVELLKREQIRLNEEKLSNNEIKPRKSENTNAFLDDAVAMYAKLRREITAGPEKREVLLSPPKSKSMSINETRPITVPGGNFKGLGTKELEDSLKPRGIERSKTFGGFMPTAQWNNSPQTTRKRDKGRFNFKNTEARGFRIADKCNAVKDTPRTSNKRTRHKKTESLKTGETKSKTNYSKKESREKSVNNRVVRMPKVQFASPPDHEQVVKEFEENELKWKGNIEIVNNRDNRQESDVQEEEREEMSSQSCSSIEQQTTTKDNLTNLNDFAQSTAKDKRRRVRSLSDSITLLNSEDKLPASSQRLKAPGFLKIGSTRPRRDSESKTEQNFDESKSTAQRSSPRKHSLTGSPRRHSQPSSISTTRLSEIISEKILEQVTNTKKRLSISSNQKTSILKSYARMLQNQLKMDDAPERDSPDFSDTPFMRSKKDQNEITDTSKAANNQGIRSTAKTLSHWTLWKNQLQLGALQSSFDYSEIEEENVLKDKERRRMSVPFFGAAGIATRKERGVRLNKLKNKHGEEPIGEEEEENTREKHELNYLEK